MDTIVSDLEARKSGETYRDSVLEDAIFYIKKAMECMDEGLQNPQKWYDDNLVTAKVFTQLFPAIYQLQQIHTNPPTEEN